MCVLGAYGRSVVSFNCGIRVQSKRHTHRIVDVVNTTTVYIHLGTYSIIIIIILCVCVYFNFVGENRRHAERSIQHPRAR